MKPFRDFIVINDNLLGNDFATSKLLGFILLLKPAPLSLL